jgi:hypothetical protein
MKFKVIILVTITFILVSFQQVNNRKKQTDVERRGLNGKVSTLNYWLVKKGISIDTIKYRKGRGANFKFNKKGFEIEYSLYFPNPNRDRVTKLEYNESERLMKSKYYSNEGKFKWEYTYEYDDKGNLIKSLTKSFNNKSFESYSLYFYNNNNLKIEERNYEWNDSTYSKTTYEYDKNQNKIKTVEYEWGNDIVSTELYQYNLNNKIKIVTELDANGDIVGSNEYEYDKFNNKIKISSLMEKSFTEFYYEFDSLNNWTKKTTMVNGEETEILTRKIEYY